MSLLNCALLVVLLLTCISPSALGFSGFSPSGSRLASSARLSRTVEVATKERTVYERRMDVCMSSGGRVGGSVAQTADVKPLSRKYMRLTIFSWWCQIVLSVVSGVILTFAQSVRKSGTSMMGFWSSGFALSTVGVGMAFVNSFWTWNMTRAARRAYLGKMETEKVVPTFRRYSRISITISLLGMFLSLLGAEQIVGTLASKVLSSQGYVPVVAAGVSQISQVQALDIFLVQANTNAILAHFVPLTSFLWSQKSLPPE